MVTAPEVAGVGDVSEPARQGAMPHACSILILVPQSAVAVRLVQSRSTYFFFCGLFAGHDPACLTIAARIRSFFFVSIAARVGSSQEGHGSGQDTFEYTGGAGLG